MDDNKSKDKEGRGSMTVEEAGRMGGQRLKELVEEGKQAEEEQGSSQSAHSWQRKQ